MKIKDGFVLRQVAGKTVVLPTDGDLNLNVMITLNDTGAYLWKQLEQACDEETLVKALLSEYDVDAETAAECVAAFVKKLDENGFLV